jgi:hypothetical protein
MKKFVFASVMAMASISLVYTPSLKAQDSITIKDPAEFTAYQQANTQSDPKAQAAALESFLTTYPQSVVKSAVLDTLIDTYSGLQDADHTLSAASRLLQIDPANMKAIYWSVLIKRGQCARSVNLKTGVSSDPQTCDDAALLARKGLSTPKPSATSSDDWKKVTGGSYPLFHSAVALDDTASKKDIKAGISEYRTELMLLPPEQTQSGMGWQDTLQLAGCYTKPDAKDLAQAVWFYARGWNFAASPQAKLNIKNLLEYYYIQYHGKLDGLDAIKAQAAATVFPAGTFVITAKATPAEIAHGLIVDTPKLDSLALSDKEFILANGVKEDADKMWAVLKDQPTPVPGLVITAPVSGLKVSVTEAGKTSDYVVALQKPMACTDIPAVAAGVQAKKDFVLDKGVKADSDKIAALSPDNKRPVTKITVDGTVSQIKVAVAQDMRSAKTADFIVNMKTPALCKDVNDAGPEYKIPPATTLVGTYDSFTVVPAADTEAPASAQIVLRDGGIQLEKKKPVAPAHTKPGAGHPAAHPAAH